MDSKTAQERITKARIQVQMKSPFFSYMSLYLKLHEQEGIETMGVDYKGNLYYSKEFVEKLSDVELQSVLCHEILHLVLLHLTRQGTRDKNLFNVATDLCINYMIRANKFTLPSGCLMANEDGVWEHKEDGITIKIEGIDKKPAEEIYEELLRQIPPEKRGSMGNGEGENNGRFDNHIYGEGLSEKEKKEVEKGWNDKTHEALTMAKMRGNVPAGMERVVGELHKEKINWRALLNNYITEQIPYNNCWSKPHKRSISVGSYVPHQLKERIEIAVCIDLSGSIGKEEYTDFLSEIIGIARAYQERVSIKFYSHDTDGYYGGLVENGNIEKIKNIKLKGCGGTSHKSVMDLMNKDKDVKAVVFFTDGYSDLNEIDFSKYSYDKVFVIQNGDDSQLQGKRCKVIKMENERR
jgi:predicted metal-dependent peptidase